MASSFKRQVAGQPLAQVDNPDPFAPPVWRSPVYQTPHFVIWPVQLVRLVWRLVWFILRHPLLDAGCAAAGLHLAQARLAGPGRPGGASPSLALACVYLLWPGWFARHVVHAARDGWRHWFYRRRWHGGDDARRAGSVYRGRVLCRSSPASARPGRSTW